MALYDNELTLSLLRRDELHSYDHFKRRRKKHPNRFMNYHDIVPFYLNMGLPKSSDVVRDISYLSRKSIIYIYGHCMKKSDSIFDNKHQSVSARKLARFIAFGASKKVKRIHPFRNLRISVLACYGASGRESSFAYRLTKELLNFGIYADVVGRTFAIYPEANGQMHYGPTVKNELIFKTRILFN